MWWARLARGTDSRAIQPRTSLTTGTDVQLTTTKDTTVPEVGIVPDSWKGRNFWSRICAPALSLSLAGLTIGSSTTAAALPPPLRKVGGPALLGTLQPPATLRTNLLHVSQSGLLACLR